MNPITLSKCPFLTAYDGSIFKRVENISIFGPNKKK